MSLINKIATPNNSFGPYPSRNYELNTIMSALLSLGVDKTKTTIMGVNIVERNQKGFGYNSDLMENEANKVKTLIFVPSADLTESLLSKLGVTADNSRSAESIMSSIFLAATRVSSMFVYDCIRQLDRFKYPEIYSNFVKSGSGCGISNHVKLTADEIADIFNAVEYARKIIDEVHVAFPDQGFATCKVSLVRDSLMLAMDVYNPEYHNHLMDLTTNKICEDETLPGKIIAMAKAEDTKVIELLRKEYY